MESDTEFVEAGNETWRAVPSDLEVCSMATVTLSRDRVSLWALVLESRSVACRAVQGDGGWILLVQDGSFVSALEELRLFEEENRNWPPKALPPSPPVKNILATLSVLLLLATFHNLTRLDFALFGLAPINWMELGSAQSAKILDGQWWRAVTALTLHSGVLHLLGNLVIGGFFVIFLCRDLGSGLAWSILAMSGTFGTLANAWFQPPYHTSVGASTLVFGAVGALAAVRVVRERSHARKRWFLPVAGSFALLAILGTEGENTDIGAHLFGFVFGAVFGLVAEYLVERFGRPGPRSAFLLALCSAALPVAAWWAALVFRG
jgi:membrane associated rhomboid family serine protease